MSKFFWLLFIGLWIGSAWAQEPTPAFQIHVVQRDETLSQIALNYGTTLSSLTQINGLVNPNSLQVGQRLIIPQAGHNGIGLLSPHQVEAGENLFTLARRYNSTPLSLAQTNQIFNARSLYVGQNLLITTGANGRLPPPQSSAHQVQVGDSWLSLSLRYQTPILSLAATNDLDPFYPLPVGQLLVIPSSLAGNRFVDLPLPLRDVQIAPLPAKQGHSLSIYVQAEATSQITGRFFDRDIRFMEQNGAYYAMLGIHALAEPGIYPIRLTLSQSDGTSLDYETRIQIVEGGYGQEQINVAPEIQGLLNPAIVQPELDRIMALMSGFTESKYFQGLMNLPSTGRVTSQYGTRRSYNGGSYNAFHGGADFGGAPGSLVTAPANGTVILAEPLNVRGNTVIIDHGWGVYTGYWHNTEIFVQTGQYLTRGDPISTIGASGLVTGAHLHWEMWVGGVQVNPLQWAIHAFDDFSRPLPPSDEISFPATN